MRVFRLLFAFMAAFTVTPALIGGNLCEVFGPGLDWIPRGVSDGSAVSALTGLRWSFYGASYDRENGGLSFRDEPGVVSRISVSRGKCSHIVVTLQPGYPADTEVTCDQGTSRLTLAPAGDGVCRIVFPADTPEADGTGMWIRLNGTNPSVSSVVFVNNGLTDASVADIAQWVQRAGEGGTPAIVSPATVVMRQGNDLWLQDDDGTPLYVEAAGLLQDFVPGDRVAPYFAGSRSHTDFGPGMLPDPMTFARVETADAPNPVQVTPDDITSDYANRYVMLAGVTVSEDEGGVFGIDGVPVENPYGVVLDSGVAGTFRGMVKCLGDEVSLVAVAFDADPLPSNSAVLDFSRWAELDISPAVELGPSGFTNIGKGPYSVRLADGISVIISNAGTDMFLSSPPVKLEAEAALDFHSEYAGIEAIHFHSTQSMKITSSTGNIIKTDARNWSVVFDDGPAGIKARAGGDTRSVYLHDGELTSIEVEYRGVTTSVDDVSVNGVEPRPIEYYTLRGVRVSDPPRGLPVIMRRGRASEVIIR